MTKKQIQKLLQKSKGIFLKLLLGILVASLFVPVFGGLVIPKVNAQVDNPPSPTVDPRGPQCSITSASQVSMNVWSDRTTVRGDEQFTLQVIVQFKTDQPGVPDIAKACESSGKSKYSFQIYAYDDNGYYNSTGLNIPGKFFGPSTGDINYGYANRQSVSLKSIGATIKHNGVYSQIDGNYHLYAYLKDDAAKADTNIYNPAKPGLLVVQSATANEQPTQLPDLPAGVSGTGTSTATDKDTVSFDELFFGVSIKSSTNDKFRNFFRVSIADKLITVPTNPAGGRTDRKNELKSFSDFDSAGGVPVEVALGPKSTNSTIRIGSNGTYISYTKLGQTYPTISYLTSNTHRIASLKTVSAEDSVFKNKDICGVSVFSTTQYICVGDKVKESTAMSSDAVLSKDQGYDFPFKLNQALTLDQVGLSSSATKLYTVRVLPTINLEADWTQWLLKAGSVAVFPPGGIVKAIEDGASPAGFTYAAEPTMKVYFEVYPNKAELDKHKDDPIPDSVPEYQDVQTGNTESGGPSTLGGDLYNFLRKVISYIILLITSVIYWIFASILVPILNALLKIRPYQDQFVNFIYPGWIIMRNVANIGFILALLWMGLRTLFQIDDAAKSRGFILWLVLMALLVNFSLVIAQGVVGIADTVQSQFLPAKSTVVEALGQKLMVDPIKFFRGQDSGATISDGSNFKVDSSAADITKPIVLLILAVAAFFSFVALIAFILVRLVALWLLYMVSPIAYVAKILPETKQYWTQWWTEFIKYAFTVPILAFFLNIAALMATTFATKNGDSVIAGRDPNYLFGNVAGDLVQYTITIISHFIVLVFIYAGMHYALKSGTFGAKQIVDGAKKGFDFVTKTAPAYAGRWAKDTGADALANSKSLRGRPGLQKAILAAARPIEATKAFKKGYIDNPREEMNKRFASQFGKLTDKVQPWGENKMFPAKMAWWKLWGQDSKAMQKEADRQKEFTEIMNDDDRDALIADRAADQSKLAMLNGGQVDSETAKGHLSKLDRDLAEATKNYNQNQNYDTRKAMIDLEDQRNAVDAAITAAGPNGTIPVAALAGFDSASMKGTLQANIDDATIQIDSDAALRSRLGFNERMDDDKKKEFMDKATEAATTAQYRERPFSKALADKEESEAREIQKGLADFDYDQLENGLTKALAENNMAAARAHFKQMADMGLTDRVMKKDNQFNKNNVEDLAGYVKKYFNKASGKTQISIIREVSNSNEKNGNAALSNAVKSLANGGGILNNINQQQQILKNKKTKAFTEMKKGDVTYTDRNGVEQFNAGVKEKIQSNNNEKKSEVVRRDLDRKVADHVLDAIRSDPSKINSFGSQAAAAILDVATPGKANVFKPHLNS